MNQLKAGVVLNYVVIGLNTVVGLLYTPYLLRMLGQSEYGLYSLVASVISYLTVLDLGFGNAIIRYTAKYRAEGKLNEQYELFGMFLLLYMIVGLTALAIGVTLFFNIDNLFNGTMTDQELSQARIMMLIMSFNLAFTFPMSIFGSIMAAYEKFVFPKVVNIVCIILNTSVMIVLLGMGYKALAMVVVQTIFNVFTLVVNYIYCKNKLKIRIKFSGFKWDFLKEVSIYSSWIFLNVIMDKIYWSTGQFVIGAIAGTAAIAVFAVAIQFHSLFMLFSSAISSVFLPKITGMVTLGKDNKEISDLFIKAGRLQNLVIVSVLLGFTVFGKSFIKLWAGPDYSDSYIITLLFYYSLYIPMIQTLGITILQARNQMRFRSILYINIAIASLFFQVVLCKLFGGVGCAIAIAGALFIGQGVIMNIYYYTKQKLDIRLFWLEIGKMNISPIVLSVLFIVIISVLKVQMSTWTELLCWLFVYTCLLLLLCYKFSMNSSERQLLLSPIVKVLKKNSRR